MTHFGAEYAQVYDTLYRDKDYHSECTAIVDVLERHGVGRGASILDVGCGTGRHAAILSEMGFLVTGTDLSPSMLNIARARSSGSYEILDATQVRDRLGHFDVVVSLFDVLSYQVSTESAVDFVSNLARSCKEGGLVVFDAWHLPGLVVDPPVARESHYRTDHGLDFRRVSTPKISWLTSTTTVEYQLTWENGTDFPSFSESHNMRAYTSMEVALLAERAGLDVLDICASPTLRHEVTENDWHIACIARRSTHPQSQRFDPPKEDSHDRPEPR